MDRVKFKTYNIDVKSAQFKNTDQSKKIDINILLNRIKIEETIITILQILLILDLYTLQMKLYLI